MAKGGMDKENYQLYYLTTKNMSYFPIPLGTQESNQRFCRAKCAPLLLYLLHPNKISDKYFSNLELRHFYN